MIDGSAPTVTDAIGAHAWGRDDVAAVAANIEARTDLGRAVPDIDAIQEEVQMRADAGGRAGECLRQRTMLGGQLRERLRTIDAFGRIDIDVEYPNLAARTGGNADHSLR